MVIEFVVRFVVVDLCLNSERIITIGQCQSYVRMNKNRSRIERIQIARQQRAQYVEGIYRPKYHTVTLKSRFRGHSRSLEIKPLHRSYTTYY